MGALHRRRLSPNIKNDLGHVIAIAGIALTLDI